jgi:hypothetical protein
MERRLEKKCEVHLTKMKNDIKDWFEENDCCIQGSQTKEDFLKFVFDFDNIKITKEDFIQTKRTRSSVSECERCNALRANGERCTRRKQTGLEYCGTHEKSQPHGSIEKTTEINKEEVNIKEVKGIYYYEDKDGVLYKTEDILENRIDPRKIV